MLKSKNKALIGVGSNLNNPISNILNALQLINDTRLGTIHRQSLLYRSQPWGNLHQPYFINQVIQITTPLSPFKLLHALQKIEFKLGRERHEKWSARTIDLDIIDYNLQKINRKHLNIPHPLMDKRNFVLVPLKEILPNYKHPISGIHITRLLKECEDTLSVEPIYST